MQILKIIYFSCILSHLSQVLRNLSQVKFPLKSSATDTEEDAVLVQKAGAGDAQSLALLYDRYAPLMYSVLKQKLGDSVEAEDIVHDVFLKLFRNRLIYDPSLGKPVAWLLTVARNAAIDKLRKRSTHQKYVQIQSIEVEEAEPAHSGPHPDELELLRYCIGILSGQQRDTLNLAYFSGLTQQEIADQMTQPLGSVKAWIRRGLLKLKDCVEAKI